MLDFLNNYFNNTSLKVKIELYLLPLFLFYLIYYGSFVLFVEETSKLETKVNLNEFENKKFDGSLLELYSKIETYAKEEKIFIVSMQKNKNIIDIKAKTTSIAMINFIYKIENINSFTKINYLKIEEESEDSLYLVDLKIDLNKFYIKEKNTYYKNSSINSSKSNISSKKINNYKINAIISDYALINGSWIKKYEYIDDYKIIDIGRDFVLLKNEDYEIRLELENEEYLKRIY
uniref:hypothetical protein n=1 Tax=Aliarcobacter sp. TaxID=2321116 RepID=UPI004048A63B